MVLLAWGFQETVAAGAPALLTDLPEQAASTEIKEIVAIAEKMKNVVERTNVRVGRLRFFMAMQHLPDWR